MSEPAVTSRPRRAVALAALVAGLLLAAAVVHVLWWSWPRPRAARPDPADLPARLLASRQLPVALWIAYPHQNLATLTAAVGRDDGAAAWMAALSRRTGLPATELPRFGPFPAPPARELAAASDHAGERVVVAARVEPLFALLSRAAGFVAGNPWLAGGEVEAFDGLAEVRWQGTLWTVTNLTAAQLAALTADGPAGVGAGPPLLAAPALAAVRLDRPLSLLPAGVHALRATADGMALATEDPAVAAGELAGAGALTLPGDLLESWGVTLLALSGPGGPLGSAGALALFRDTGNVRRLGPLTFEVPAAAVWHRPGERSFSLPGAGILSRLGLGGDEARDGWRITATGSEVEGRARAVTPAIAPLLSRLRFGLWADPRPALATVDDVARFLEAVPLAGRDEAQRWRDWQVLLAPLAACDRLSVAGEERSLHVAVTGC
ncbi:MAG TPA: hypothetical protein VM617_00760 [Thermoanaerobaculia bacterium]|nr:hypothetical protein [Thermoanaerobaculia bacterium]